MNKVFLKSTAFADNIRCIDKFFDLRSLRRMDNLSKISLYAAAKTLYYAGLDLKSEKEDIALIIATGRGPVLQTCNFMDSIIDDGDILASPLAFSASVHNALETAITINLNLKGPCITICQGKTTFISALNTAKSWLASKRCKFALVLAADERHPVIFKEYKNKLYGDYYASGFLLSSEDNGKEFILKDYKEDEMNPSLYAFELAKENTPFVTESDFKRIMGDFIKTQLASSRSDIMSVFDNKATSDLLENVENKEKDKIYKGLDLLTSLSEDIKITKDNIEKVYYDSFIKSDAINFFTSGSTGIPKNAINSKAMIREEVEGVSFLFEKIKRIVSTVPSHHSYGFVFALQLPYLYDYPVFSYPPIPLLEWDNILKEGDLLVTFPMFLNYMADLDFSFPSGITILTSTAPCPDALMQKIYDRGAQRIIEIYGASETGAIGFREKPGNPFSLLPHWDYSEKDGNVDIISRKKTSFKCELPDIAKIKGDRVFSISGRKDNAVQVAGVNVYPSKVEKILKHHKYIKDTMVRLGKERLKAFIVLKEDIDVSIETAKQQIHNYMKETLTPHELPKHITFGKELPHTPFGKKADWD